ARGAHAQAVGRVARERILANDNVDKPPELKTAGEKLVAAAYLLQAMPEPSTTSGRNLRREAQALIEQAAVQQAESSASRMRSIAPKQPGGTARQDHETSVHTPPEGKGKASVAHDAKAPSVRDRIGKAPARERLHDTRGHAGDGDTRYIINDRKYTPRRGGRLDPEHDRGESPEPPGTLVFSREIQTAPFPPRFRQPTTLVKYSGETDLAIWLNDYRLACQLGGATEDAVIIRNLPLHLADATRTWLEHLPADQIHNWADLVHIFVGNFQGMFVRPGNSWDLKGCRQKPRESLRDYVRCFSKRYTELPGVTHVEVINAFLEGTTCRNLVHELARSQPVNTNELFDAATNYAAGEEAVGAIFDDKSSKRKDDAPAEGSNVKLNAPAKKQKRGRKGKKPAPPNQRGSGQTEDSEEAFAAAPDRKGPRGPPRGGGGQFDDMLKKPCPYHKGPVNHTLEQCEMLKKYYNRVANRDEDKKKDAGDKGGDGEFPPVENAFFIFGGAMTNMTSRQRKREHREVFSVTRAMPSYLDWSKD